MLEAILQHDVLRVRTGQPVEILTAFGWILAGSVKSIVKHKHLHVMHVHRVLNVEESLSKQVEDWWLTESFSYEDVTPHYHENKSTLETLENCEACVQQI